VNGEGEHMTPIRNQSHLAELLSVSKAAVCKQVARGMPVTTLEDAQAWRAANLNPAQRKANRDGSTNVGRPQGAPTGDDDLPSDENFLAARTRREIAEANLAELKEAEQMGKVIQVEAVRAAWARRLASTRDAILQIPVRVAPVLAAETSIEQVSILLEAELRQALHELSRSGGTV
jgi:phage terminase Nu1 subunit (DNA packaging protein)